MKRPNYAVELRDISKSFGKVKVLQDLSLTVNHGEILALLGPSGCGKSTTLNIIAGFYPPDDGHIYFDGQNVDGIPTHKRNLGMVFQSYSLFPHNTVFSNVAFGLSVRNLAKSEIHERVMWALSLVRLPNTADRFPAQLSGGQQQRIALARALVVRPKVLLMDEPLSNLDARLRKEMQVELKRIHEDTGVTMIYVTHDQEEAVTLANRIALMRRGVIEQLGDPTEVYEFPKSRYAAHFMGFSNFMKGEIERSHGDELIVKLSGDHFVKVRKPDLLDLEKSVVVAIREGRIVLEELSSKLVEAVDSISTDRQANVDDVDNRIKGKIEECVYTGDDFVVFVACRGGLHLQLRTPVQNYIGTPPQVGMEATVYLPQADLRLVKDN